MNIGSMLKNARIRSGLTQERVAEELLVSRQTISNWENEKTYPDIMSVIKLSDLYEISLDELLKGDEKMMKHLNESTDVVKSNRNLMIAILVNIVVVVGIVIFNSVISENIYFIAGVLIFAIFSALILFYQIISRF
ncbi:MAG: helix-turn-helix transcriptional regulator [Hespellia sp.]|nr:helix-turn-helix transcriptional regulator [Hespellia sp.]